MILESTDPVKYRLVKRTRPVQVEVEFTRYEVDYVLQGGFKMEEGYLTWIDWRDLETVEE